MTACWVHGCTAPATRTVQIQAPGWRVPESRRVCIAHAESITQEPPMSKTQPTQAERVLEDVRAHPWTSVGDIVRRTRDAKAAARLVEAVQAGRIVRIGEQRSYRYAVPGTPIPGLAEVAPVEESPDFGIADPPGATERRPALRARLLAALGGLGEGAPEGDDALIGAVEELRSDLEAEKQASEARAVTLDGIREALGTTAAGRGLVEAVERIVAERDELDILATANANLREIGGGIAKRRVGCTVALGSGSAFFALSDEAARTLAPLLFQGVTIALLAPSLAKPTPVVPEFPTAPTPDDDADLMGAA